MPPSQTSSLKRALVRNTAWNYVGFAVNIFTNFVLFPVVVHGVGEAAAGIWLLLGSVTGYMGLLELGIVPALTQHVAAALGAGARDALDRAVSSAMTVLLVMAVIALQALWAVPAFLTLLHVPASLAHEATLVFTIAIAGVALRMPLAAYQAVLLGCQRQDRCNQLWIGLALVKAIGTVGVLAAGGGIVGIVAMEAIAHLAAGVLQRHWVAEALPELRLRVPATDARQMRELLGFGGAVLAVNMCALVIEQTDRVVIAAFLTLSQVTHYAAAWKLYMLAYALPTISLQALAPALAHLHGRGDVDAIREGTLRTTKYAAAIGVPLCAGLAGCAAVLLKAWMGPDYVAAAPVLQALLAGFAVSIFNHAGYSAMLGMRRIGGLLPRYYVPQAVLNLGLSLLLVGPLGPLGVALGTAIPALVLEYVFVRYMLRTVDLSGSAFFGSSVLPVLWPAVAFVPLAVAHAVMGPEWLGLVPLAAACGLAYAALFWLRSVSAAERLQLLGLVRARLWRPAPQGVSQEP